MREHGATDNQEISKVMIPDILSGASIRTD